MLVVVEHMTCPNIYSYEFINYILLLYFIILYRPLNTHNWYNLFLNVKINEATTRFYNVLNNYINLFIPKFTKRNSHFPNLYSNYLKKLNTQKKIAHKKYIISND